MGQARGVRGAQRVGQLEEGPDRLGDRKALSARALEPLPERAREQLHHHVRARAFDGLVDDGHHRRMPDLGLGAELALQPLQHLAALEEGEVAEDVLQLLDADVGPERDVLAPVHRAERTPADGLAPGVAAIEVGAGVAGGSAANRTGSSRSRSGRRGQVGGLHGEVVGAAVGLEGERAVRHRLVHRCQLLAEELAHLAREAVEVGPVHHPLAGVGQLQLRLAVHRDVVELPEEEEVGVELEADRRLQRGLHLGQLVRAALLRVVPKVLEDEERLTAHRVSLEDCPCRRHSLPGCVRRRTADSS